MHINIGRLQPACESRIEAGKTVAVVEVGEAEAMAQRRRSHCRNIRVGRGVIRSCANRLNNTDRERKAPAHFATFMPDDEAGGLKHGPAPMQTAPASVRNWLLVVSAMIFFMIVLGALTRLTESGLSMVEWRPVTGWLPPMSDAAWQAELQKYLSSPQGRLVNRGFSVDEFRSGLVEGRRGAGEGRVAADVGRSLASRAAEISFLAAGKIGQPWFQRRRI